jgi:hypothetical protein
MLIGELNQGRLDDALEKADALPGSDLPDMVIRSMRNYDKSCIHELFYIVRDSKKGSGKAALTLLVLALDGQLTLPFSCPALRPLIPRGYAPALPQLFRSVDVFVHSERAQWRRHDIHLRLLLATDCRDVGDFDISAFAELETSLQNENEISKIFSQKAAPYVLLHAIEKIPGSPLVREIRHLYLLWRASKSDSLMEFNDFKSNAANFTHMRVHGHTRERIELLEQQINRRENETVCKKRKKQERPNSEFIKALKKISLENSPSAPEDYFGALRNGSASKGFRPAGWLTNPTNYPYRSATDIKVIGEKWFIAMRGFLAHRKKNFETDAQIKQAFHILADYLLLYLPWWMEKNVESGWIFPSSPKDFIRYGFVDRTDFSFDQYDCTAHCADSDEATASQRYTMPKTLYELLPLRNPTPEARNSTRISLQKLFAFVLTYFEDDKTFVDADMRNPIWTDFDNEAAGRRHKTNKIPIPEDVFPFLVQYGQALEAFGEHLQQRAYFDNSFSDKPFGCSEGYTTEDWGFVPMFWYWGKLYKIEWIPNIFTVASRRLQSNPDGDCGLYVHGYKINVGVSHDRTLNFPHLTTVRMLNSLVETGLRAQSLQWLDRRSYDSSAPPLRSLSNLYGDILMQSFQALFINTDKTHDPWKNLVSWRVRRSLIAEDRFQGSLMDVDVASEVFYEDREVSRFTPVQPLFRSHRSESPISDTLYCRRWVELLYSFEKFYNAREEILSDANW